VAATRTKAKEPLTRTHANKSRRQEVPSAALEGLVPSIEFLPAGDALAPYAAERRSPMMRPNDNGLPKRRRWVSPDFDCRRGR
jgi:hypothetical protein